MVIEEKDVKSLNNPIQVDSKCFSRGIFRTNLPTSQNGFKRNTVLIQPTVNPQPRPLLSFYHILSSIKQTYIPTNIKTGDKKGRLYKQ